MEDNESYQKIKIYLLERANKGRFMYSRFIRDLYNEIEALSKSYQLSEIIVFLNDDLNMDLKYNSFIKALGRYKSKNTINKKVENVITVESEEIKTNTKISENKKSVSDEIKDSEKNIELDWIKKPKFDHLNKKEIIETIIEYGITEQEVIDLNLPLYTLKCLDLLISYGEEKKAKEIGKLYFGN